MSTMYDGADGVAYLNATKEFHVTSLMLNKDSVAVSAAAGTGWRYDVVVTMLPHPLQGGRFVTTVLSPWTAAYPLGDPFGVRAEDVVAHFVPRDRLDPADVAAMTATINYALQQVREHYLTAEEKGLQ